MLKQKVAVWNRKARKMPVPRPTRAQPKHKAREQQKVNALTSTSSPRAPSQKVKALTSTSSPEAPSKPKPKPKPSLPPKNVEQGFKTVSSEFSTGHFSGSKFNHAEKSRDLDYFRKCVLSHPHATYLWTSKSGTLFPCFSAYLRKLEAQDPALFSEWTMVTDRANIPQASDQLGLSTTAQEATPVAKQVTTHQATTSSASLLPEPFQDGKSPMKPADLTTPREIPPKPPDPSHSTTETNSWAVDPTPPDGKQVIPVPGRTLSEKPLEINPTLYWSLNKKAVQRWNRGFDTIGTGGVYRLLKRSSPLKPQTWVPNKAIAKMRDRTMIVIPSPKSVKATLRRVLDMKTNSPGTAVLMLVPQTLMDDELVSTFMHAYAERGETYRQGPLFREIGQSAWLQLNQAVHEFWVNPEGQAMPKLDPRKLKLLQRLLDKYQAQLGDANTSAAQRQSSSSHHIPYVRLPVKPGAQPASEPPFKKNPTVRQLTIDFVRDLERRGLASRCTAEEAVFVCNSLMLPKPSGKYRFVCTFTQLNANMIKDPYGMRTLDAILTALEGSTWFTVLDVVDGFFNLPLYPADRGYTAFHTPIGVYKWNVLPQGTSASPQIFQRTMDRWFSAFLWKSVIIWMDDLLVHSTTFSEHLRHLGQFSTATS